MSPLLRTLVLFTVALASVCATGCTQVESAHPLCDARDSLPDDRLIGHWVAVSPKPEEAPKGDGDGIAVHRIGAGYEAWGVAESRPVVFHATQIGDWHFLNIAGEDAQQSPVHMICRYEFVGADRLQLWLLCPDKTAAAIEKGEIAGEVTVERTSGKTAVNRVRLQATSAELRKFFATAAGRSLVSDEKVLIFRRAGK